MPQLLLFNPTLVENCISLLEQIEYTALTFLFMVLKYILRLYLFFFPYSDTFHSHKKLPLISSLMMPQEMFVKGDEFAVSSNEAIIENVNEVDVYGTGLKNEVGEYNCFLNVIIQVGLENVQLYPFKGTIIICMWQCLLYHLMFCFSPCENPSPCGI